MRRITVGVHSDNMSLKDKLHDKTDMTATDDDARNFGIREAKWHMERAKEILEESLSDPERFRRETLDSYRFMAPFLAVMLCASTASSRTESDNHPPQS